VAYGDIQALWDVSFEADAGEIISIVGANGAGKTTLVRTVSGILHPSGGKIFYDGEDITRLATYDILARGIVHVPEGRQLFHDMTVQENLDLGPFPSKPRNSFGKVCRKCSPCSPVWKSATINSPGLSAAANSRCSPSVGV
jgi:branched-chain amino acid transport system ATP-binding protein